MDAGVDESGHMADDADLTEVYSHAAMQAVNEVGTLFFAKDHHRRFIMCSDAFVRLMGYASADQIIGLRDEDISPEYLVDHYRGYDEKVLRRGEHVIDLVELVRNVDGSYDWFVTTKWPIFAGPRIVGLGGVTRSLTPRHPAAHEEFPLAAAVELIARDYGRQLTVTELADAVSMSPSYFTRRFKSHFGTTPHRYLRQVRLMAVADLLSTTDMPLTKIARATGHYDQSHMSNEFARERGLTPSSYRRLYQGSARRPASGAG